VKPTFISIARSVQDWPKSGNRELQVEAHLVQAKDLYCWMRTPEMPVMEKSFLLDLAVANLGTDASVRALFLARIASAYPEEVVDDTLTHRKPLPTEIVGQLVRLLIDGIPEFIQTEYNLTRYSHSVRTALRGLMALLHDPNTDAKQVRHIVLAMLNDEYQREFIGEQRPVIEAALRHEHAPLDLLPVIATNPSRLMRRIAAAHPDCPEDVRIMAALLGT
jgi:hypothetical protein